MPQLTFITNHGFEAVTRPIQALTYCLIGALIITAVWVGQVTMDNPSRLSGEIVGSELLLNTL